MDRFVVQLNGYNQRTVSKQNSSEK